MNAREANVMLTKAALLDARMKRVDPQDQADMATEWAAALADVQLTVALKAVRVHYMRETRPIMPADVHAYADEVDDGVPNTTTERELEQRNAWLLEHGIAPEEWDRRVAAGEKPIRILADSGIDLREITA